MKNFVIKKSRKWQNSHFFRSKCIFLLNPLKIYPEAAIGAAPGLDDGTLLEFDTIIED